MTSRSNPGAESLSEPALMVVGTLLYSIKFDILDDALVDRRAHALIEEPLRELSLDEEYQAIVEALASGATLSEVIEIPDWVRTRPNEDEFRDFLRRLRDQLDAMRPWPTPPHRKLSRFRWTTEYTNARVVGRIKIRYVDAQGRVNYVFSGVQDGDLRRRVLILQLRSGDEVALVAPWWPGSEDVAVLSRDPDRPPPEVLAALLDGTRFTSDEVEQAPPDDPANPPKGDRR